MNVRLNQIKESFSAISLFTDQLGADVNVTNIAPAETCQPGDLVFVESRRFVEYVLKNKPSAVITHPKLAEAFEPGDDLGILITPMVGVAHALLKQKFADRDFKDEQWGETRHSSAVIHESAKIADSAIIYPNVTIGANTKVGENTRILSGVTIENDVTIGNDCTIHPNAVIGYDSEIGNEVIIGLGTVIGSEGYGFGQDHKFRSHRIPQTGKVIIEDRVRLGANNCVDRAAYDETRIGAGTKTDNLCHFAHGVQIGENCLLTAMFCIAGSSKVGDRVVASGQTGIIDHVSIADDVWLLHRAGVVKNIEEPGKYCALPLQELGQYKRNMTEYVQLETMSKRVQELEKKIEDLNQ